MSASFRLVCRCGGKRVHWMCGIHMPMNHQVRLSHVVRTYMYMSIVASTLHVFGNRTMGTQVLLAAERQHICTCLSIARWTHTDTCVARCELPSEPVNILNKCLSKYRTLGAHKCCSLQITKDIMFRYIKPKQHVFVSHAGRTQVLLAADYQRHHVRV
jgi:hypothetical protein